MRGLIITPIKNLFFSKISLYIYKELLPNYAFGLAFFSSLILLNEFFYLARLYIEHNIPLIQVLYLLLYLIPFLLSFSVPFAVLPAYLLTMGRFSQDSEIIAMKSCGISTFRIIFPGLFLGIIIAVSSGIFNNYVVVPSNEAYIKLRAKIMSQKPAIEIKEKSFLEIGGYKISFDKIENYGNIQVLYKVHAIDFRERKVIQAKMGRIYTDPENAEHYIIKLLDGSMSEIIKEKKYEEGKGEIIQEKFFVSSFNYLSIHFFVRLPAEFYAKGPDLMKIDELREDIINHYGNMKNIINEIINRKNNIKQELSPLISILKQYEKNFDENSQLNEVLDIGNKVTELLNNLNELDKELERNKKILPYYQVMKYNEKFALPFASFVFSLISMSLGIFSARSGKGEGLGLSILIMLIFYGLKVGVENLIIKQFLPPIAEWGPNILFLTIGLILLFIKIRS